MNNLKLIKKNGIHALISNRSKSKKFYQKYARFIFEDKEDSITSKLRRVWNQSYASYYNNRINFLSRLLEHFVNPSFKYKLNQRQSIIDIGCSTGLFLDVLDNRFWKRYGVEVNSSAVQIARSKGVTVFEGDFDSNLIELKFDIVRASHVVEHVIDPDKFISKVSLLCKTNGLVVVSTPNLMSFSRYLFGDNWIGYYDETHQNIMSIDYLIKLGKKYDLEVIEKKTYFMNYFGYSIVRLLKINNSLISSLIFNLFYFAYLPFSIVENKFLNGDAVFVVFKKND